MSEFLLAHNLHKSYDNGGKTLHVLKGISLKVIKGKVLAIVGPSGAGKSTLLHILGGLDRAISGSVFLNGVDIYKLGDRQRARLRNRRIGFVFQFYHLLAEFTALENVMLPATIKKAPMAKQKGQQLLEKVGLGHRMNHLPSQLSGGECQRVAIARALINEPAIVFCDEPTGNLDSKTGGLIYDIIWRLNKEKKQTFVIATHEERIVKRADEVCRIKDGELVSG